MRIIRSIALFFTISFLIAPTVQAEYFGMLNGRGGDLREMPNLSIDAGFVTGDYYSSSYDMLGARVNYRIMPGLMAYADFGRTDLSPFFDGNAIGLGVYYQLQNLIPGLHSSIRGGFHRVDLSSFFFSQDLDVISVEFLVSGQEPILVNGLSWYANAGINRIDAVGSRGGSDTEPGIGAGMYLPLGPGQVYFGADFIDEIMFGAGFRFSIR